MDNIQIGFEEIKSLMAKVPDGVQLTIVGGQALSFWVTAYYQQYKELFESNDGIVWGTADIDIVASSRDAELCAKAWDATITLPEKFSNTPNTAIVRLNLPGKGFVEIDFLSDYVRLKDVNKVFYSNVSLSSEKPIFVLSQVTLLLAKTGNVLVLRRTNSHALGHLRAAILVVRCHLDDLLSKSELESAQKIIKLILYLARNRDVGRTLYNSFQIDFLEAIPLDLSELDPRYVEMSIEPEIGKINAFRTM